MRPATATAAARNWSMLFPPGSRVVALPGWRQPRLLIAAETMSERVAGSAFFPAYRATGRLYRWALRLRATSAMGARRSPPNGQAALADFLGDVLPGARVRAVQVGVPGRTCKLTAQLVDDAGRVVGYVKCADSPLTRRRLRHEHALLERLPRGAGPNAIKYGSIAACELLLQTPVSGTPLKAPLDPPPALRSFCHSLIGATTHSIAAHPWVRAQHDASGMIVRYLEALSGRSWPAAIQHGDMAPWNLIQHADGSLSAIDWEYGSLCGFPGLDLAQYVLQVAALIRRACPADGRAHAIRQLLADEELALETREAAALVALAARKSYRTAVLTGYPATFWAQVWRKRVWELGLHA